MAAAGGQPDQGGGKNNSKSQIVQEKTTLFDADQLHFFEGSAVFVFCFLFSKRKFLKLRSVSIHKGKNGASTTPSSPC